jgi:IS5 family transposase
MKPKAKPKTNERPLIATMRLDLSLDLDHELVRLAGVIPWDRLAEEFGPLYCADNGRPGVPIRLMAGLHSYAELATTCARCWPGSGFACTDEA